MTLGSLFDGIAGFPLAAERQGIKTVWISEIEANCIEIAKRHFPDAENLGDITEIDGGRFRRLTLSVLEALARI
jgi:DNA (cytosine-5)-methyltransferase 1